MAASPEQRRNAPRPSVSGRLSSSSVETMSGKGSHGSSNGQTLLSRRGFLYGAIGVGAVAAVGIGVAVVGSRDDNSDDPSVLKVPVGSILTLDSLSLVEETKTRLYSISEFDLPYGTLVWANSDTVAACLIPTDTGSPLSHVGILTLGNATLTTLLTQAIGAKEGFEIYDVRATEVGIVWTEANVLEGLWRIYTALLEGEGISKPLLVAEGDETYETPTLAAVGKHAFWQVMPPSTNTEDIPSTLYHAVFGADRVTRAYVSNRRMSTPPYATEDSVVITPRRDGAGAYYQLTRINAESLEATDTMTLPSGMRPLEAGWGRNGFMFAFDAIYDYDNGISNLGTYTPSEDATDGNFNSVRWFGFARTPTAPPAWCGNYLIVKSSYSICGIDFRAGEYFAVDVEDGADDYGEYLATTGTHERIVTFTNIDDNPVNGAPIKACRVKVYRAAERSS